MGGMPGGMPFGAGGMGGGGRSFHFSTGGDNKGAFSFSNPEDILSDFLRSQGGGGGGGEADPFSGFPVGGFGMGGMGGSGARVSGNPYRSRPPRFGEANGGLARQPAPEVQIVEKQLPVTLEELYKGVHKRMKVQRKTFDALTQKRTTQDRILEMDIKPGLRAGSKIKFKGVGDQEEGTTQDFHFIVTEVRLHFSEHASQDAKLTHSAETASKLHSSRRRSPHLHHTRPQGSPHRLEKTSSHH